MDYQRLSSDANSHNGSVNSVVLPIPLASEVSPSQIKLVVLRWEDEDEDFGVAVVNAEATLSHVRNAIQEQFVDLPERINHDYQFVMEGTKITHAQEPLVPVGDATPLLLRPTFEKQFTSGKGDVVELTPDNNDILKTLEKVSGDSNITSPTFERDLNENRRFSRSQTLGPPSEFAAKMHVSGQEAVDIDKLDSFIEVIERLKTDANSRTVIWLDIQSSRPDELERIGRAFQLHPLTIEDISVDYMRQKVEAFHDYMLISLHGLPLPHENRDYFDNLHVIVSSNVVMTLHHSPVPTLDSIRKRLRKVNGKEIPSTATLVHAIIDCIVDYDTFIVDQSVQDMDSLEDLVYMLSQSEQSDLLRRMGVVRRRLTVLRQGLWSRRDIITQLMSRERRSFLSGVRVAYFRDVLDHVLTMIQKLELSQDLLNSLQSTYLAKVSIEVAKASNNINLVMKNISSFATAFLPMTFITGLWGMNVKVPFQVNDTSGETPIVFYTIIAVMIAIVIPFIYVMRRMKWL
uniref:Magnesium transporter n=1 Tax=Spongospora subterranea TaxID=70186 RepID=A0A0H5RBL7_9EUKA|eukprot:CRZ11017.1 hypothetical protein [Spongospora subterranea]